MHFVEFTKNISLCWPNPITRHIVNKELFDFFIKAPITIRKILEIIPGKLFLKTQY